MANNASLDYWALQAPPLARAASGCSEAPATVGEYISGVVLKELWAVQLHRQPSAFDRKAAKDLVARVSPDLAHDILDAVRGWIPIADELCPSTLLPDLDAFPPSVADEDGISLVQRKLLLEALKIVFDVFNEDGAAGLSAGETPILPRPSVAAVSVQIAAMLEHLSLTRPRGGEAQLQQGELDLGAWQNVCAHAGGQAQPGSKRELIEELQQCHRQIFDLEKELVTQVKIADASANREKREADKAVQRLTAVNQALEEKLRSRTDESRQSSKRICDLERRISHEQNLVQEKGKKILILENELARTARMQDDLLLRERMYGERILKLRLEEFMSICRDNQRQKKLECAIKGQCTIDDENANVGEQDLCKLAEESLRRVQNEFDGYFEDREKNMLHVAEQCEAKIAKREAQLADGEGDADMNVVNHRLSRRSRKSTLHLETQSVAVQTEPAKKEEQLSSSPSARASVCGADFILHNKHSVRAKAEMDLMRAKRQSITLGQPLRKSVERPMGAAASEPAPSFQEAAHGEEAGEAAACSASDGHSEEEEEGAAVEQQAGQGDSPPESKSASADGEQDGAAEQDGEVSEAEDSPPRAPCPPAAAPPAVRVRGKLLAAGPPRIQTPPPAGTSTTPRALAKHAQLDQSLRSVTPSTRASSRTESNGRTSALAGSRSSTPWQLEPLEQRRESRQLRSRDTWHAGPASGRRSVLTFDRGVN